MVKNIARKATQSRFVQGGVKQGFTGGTVGSAAKSKASGVKQDLTAKASKAKTNWDMMPRADKNLVKVGAVVAGVGAAGIVADVATMNHPSPTADRGTSQLDLSGEVADIEKDFSKGRLSPDQRYQELTKLGVNPNTPSW